jgi:hypothetical protein
MFSISETEHFPYAAANDRSWEEQTFPPVAGMGEV